MAVNPDTTVPELVEVASGQMDFLHRRETDCIQENLRILAMISAVDIAIGDIQEYPATGAIHQGIQQVGLVDLVLFIAQISGNGLNEYRATEDALHLFYVIRHPYQRFPSEGHGEQVVKMRPLKPRPTDMFRNHERF